VESTLLGRAGRWAAAVLALGFLALLLGGEQDPTVLVGGALVLTFVAGAPTGRAGAIAPLDLALAGLTVAVLLYRPDALARLGTVGAVTETDLLMAAAFLLALAEAGRRVAGWPALVGVLLWSAALLVRDRLPDPLRAPPIDPVVATTALVYGTGSLVATSFALIVEWFGPIVVFAGVARGARLVPLLASVLRPAGLAPAATALAAPVLVEPDSRAGAGAVPTLRALYPLTPPALGLGALLVGQAIGTIGDLGWRLVPPAALALLIVVARRRVDRWRRVWPPPLPARPRFDRQTAGLGLVLAAPVVVAALLALAPPATSFVFGAGLMLTGALVARPVWATARELVAGLVWAARQLPLAGALLVFLALVVYLNEASGLLEALGDRWLGLEPQLEALLFATLSIAAGALLLPPAAMAFVVLSTGTLLPDPPGALVAALFWVGAATILVGRLTARAFFGRLVWATPLLLVALVASRAAFEERGPGAPLIVVAEGLAALVVGYALGTRAPLGAAGRLVLIALGVFLLSPSPPAGALVVVAAVATIVLATATGRPAVFDTRRWGAGKLVSRIRLPRQVRRS
jgi:hypothetical protein